MGMTNRKEYKETNGAFSKLKVRLCWDQQIEVLQLNQRDNYLPVLKSAEVSIMVAIAAQHGAKMYKSDTTQATLLYSDEEDLYVRTPDWWQELVLEGHCLQLKRKSTGYCRLPKHGISVSPDGWSRMAIPLITARTCLEDYAYDLEWG